MIMDNFYNSAGAFKLGDFVQKKSGSSWRGKVVGFYATDMTPRGYCVESTNEPGSVQIYPETALVEWKPELSHPSAIREAVEGCADMAVVSGELPATLGNAVSDAIFAAIKRGMGVDEAVSVVVAVASDYGCNAYGESYRGRLAELVRAHRARGEEKGQ